MKSPLKIKLFLLCTFVFLMQGIVFAQVIPPADPSSDPDVPITGIEILIGAGALIGARKIASLRKKSGK
jgi:hypothetical protein